MRTHLRYTHIPIIHQTASARVSRSHEPPYSSAEPRLPGNSPHTVHQLHSSVAHSSPSSFGTNVGAGVKPRLSCRICVSLTRPRANGAVQALRLFRLDDTCQRTNGVIGYELLRIQPLELLECAADMVKTTFACHDADTEVNNFLESAELSHTT